MPAVLAVAVLPDVVIGCLLILFLLATKPIWSRALVGFLSELPLVGAWAAGNAERLVNGLMNALQGWVAAGVGPLSHLVANFAANSDQLGARTTRAVTEGLLTLAWLKTTYVPRLVGSLSGELAIRYGWLVDRIEREAVIARDAVSASAQAVLATAAAEVATLRSELYTEYGWLAAGIDRALAQALAATEAMGGILRREFGGQLGQLADQVEVKIDGVSAADAARAAAIAAAAAAATAAVATAVKAIEDSACMKRCDTLGGLGAELELLDFGLVLAMLAPLIENPKGSADALVSEAGEELTTLGRELAGMAGWSGNAA